MQNSQPNSPDNEYLYGRPFYPTAPMSWLAPLWSFLCGVIASGNWTWTGSSLLRLLLGLLLVGPLLGLAWAAGIKLQWHARSVSEPESEIVQDPVPLLPYTQPGSASHRFVNWLATLSSWWQKAKPSLGRPLLQLTVSSIFALTVAAQLGRQNSAGLEPFRGDALALTTLGLIVAYISAFSCRGWAFRHIFATQCDFIPLLLTWLLGHASYGALRLASAIVAASFALALYGYFAVHSSWCSQRLGPLLWQIVPQIAVAACLVVVKQPVAAATVTLLGTLQLLILPLLGTTAGHERYFRAVQFPLLASMFLASLALGHAP